MPRQDGQIPYRAVDQVSLDGKTQTMTVRGVTPDGGTYTNIAVYDRM